MNVCLKCNREVGKRNKFCSSSCAASYNNKLRILKPKKHCKFCNKELSLRIKKFCDNKCQHLHSFDNKILPDYRQGILKQRGILRKILNIERGHICSVCGITEWNGKNIVLEVDHIDGNADNNMPSNLRLICPNCHSQTETYKGANRGNGRTLRKPKAE
jgi:hypothetical protein